jgi:hypothetical protein
MASTSPPYEGSTRGNLGRAGVVAVYTALISALLWSALAAASPGTAGLRQQLRSLGLSEGDADTAAAAVTHDLREQWLWSALVIGVMLGGWFLYRRTRSSQSRTAGRRWIAVGIAMGLAFLLPVVLFVASIISDAAMRVNDPAF